MFREVERWKFRIENGASAAEILIVQSLSRESFPPRQVPFNELESEHPKMRNCSNDIPRN